MAAPGVTIVDFDDAEVTDERELSAIVAHGLLNTLAVISGSAATMLKFQAALREHDREVLVAALVFQSQLFTEGLDLLLRYCSDTFADAAWIVESIGRRYRTAAADDQAAMLLELDASVATLKDGLVSLVRGLPPDTIDLLDSLQQR